MATNYYPWLLDYYAMRGGCYVCGIKSSLVGHHLAGRYHKNQSLSNLARRGRWKELQEELRLCLVLCTKCHQELHGLKFSPLMPSSSYWERVG